MASFLRQEIKDAVKEEISRVLGTTANNLPGASTEVKNNRTSTEQQSERNLTFEEFYSLREDERQDGFKPPKKKKKKTTPSKSTIPTNKVTDVEVKVGIASQVDGILKARRGKTHSVTVKSTADRQEITKKATAKHSSFDQNFDGSISYVLLFPDFSEVIFVPGTKEQFVLSSYKKAIGEDYKRLTFLLIPTEEFEDRGDDTDNSSAEECAQDGGIAKYFTGRAGCSTPHRQESIDLNGDDDNGNLPDAPASLEGKGTILLVLVIVLGILLGLSVYVNVYFCRSRRSSNNGEKYSANTAKRVAATNEKGDAVVPPLQEASNYMELQPTRREEPAEATPQYMNTMSQYQPLTRRKEKDPKPKRTYENVDFQACTEKKGNGAEIYEEVNA